MAKKNNVARGARRRARALQGSALAASAIAALAVAPGAGARERAHWGGDWGHQRSQLFPDSVVISGTVFPSGGVNIGVGQSLPFASNWGNKSPEPTPVLDAQAVAGGQYPYVFNNDGPDGSFGVDTPIDLWDVSPWGQPLSTIQVPTDEMTTSFESKSELAINLSTDGQDLSFSGYNAPDGSLDASNSDTPGIVDPTNPDLAGPYFRVAGDLSSDGRMSFTETNSYTGDNQRAVLLDNADNQFFASGNDNNGSLGKSHTSPIPASMIDATGAQIYPQSLQPESVQTAAGGDPASLMGTFNIAWLPQYSTIADKPGKDTNFRGLTEYGNVVYYSKGSGGNGVNTVYFVDTTGSACSQTDPVGIPAPGAQLPAPGTTYNLCILRGLNEQAASADNSDFPFGMWFANADTLYVADEGNGNFGSSDPNSPYADAQAEVGNGHTGLQKWVFNQSTQSWQLAYTLQNGLDLGQPYSVPGYPTGDNSTEGGSGLPWAPATDGLRNISGRINGDGSVTIYATTSTVSGSGDQGGDPNQVVAIRDWLGADNANVANYEAFRTIAPPRFGVRYGGVAVLPPDFGGQQHGWGHDGSR